jgi:hypothetical protein
LREYVIGNPSALPFPKQAALVSVIRAEERAAREARPPSKAAAHG